MLPAIDNYYRDTDLVQRGDAMCSCGIAAQTLILAAKALGYERIGKLINLSDDHVIAIFLASGKGTKVPLPQRASLKL